MHGVAVTSSICRPIVTVLRLEKPCFSDQLFAGTSYCSVGAYETAVTLHWPHLQYILPVIKCSGSRRRCEQLQSLNEVVTTRCVGGSTSETLVLYTYYLFLLLLIDLSQPQPAEQVFNVYHKKDTSDLYTVTSFTLTVFIIMGSNQCISVFTAISSPRNKCLRLNVHRAA